MTVISKLALKRGFTVIDFTFAKVHKCLIKMAITADPDQTAPNVTEVRMYHNHSEIGTLNIITIIIYP